MKSSQFKNEKKPHLFAHRGGNAAGDNKENTKRAFTSATHLGYKFLETDVILTRDKQVICYHGAQNWYMKHRSGLEVRSKVQKLTYKQIQDKIVLGSEPVPKMKDILASFPNSLFSIDVKTKEVVVPLASLLKELKVGNRVIVTSFSLRRTLKANRLLRGHKGEAALCISRFSPKLIRPIDVIFLRFMRFLGITYLEVSYTRISKRLMNLSRRHGISIYAWTVNDQENIQKMLSFGADGIMSDETKLLMSTAKTKKA